MIFARPEDPVTSAFSRFAADRGLSTWQPKQLKEISWSFHLDGETRCVEIRDRCSNRCWQANDLAGIWYQSFPPFPAGELDERDQRYVAAEYGAAARAIWHEAPCVVIGQPPDHTPRELFDFGLESRVHLRRLGLPTLSDRIGTLATLPEYFEGTPADMVRVTRADGPTSAWLSELTAEPESSERASGELMAATVTDGRPARVAVHVDDDTLVFAVEKDGLPHLIETDGETEALLRRVRVITGARMGVTYLGHEAEEWRLARLSLQIPYWLAGIVDAWLFPQLFELFNSKTLAHTAAGSPR